MIRRIAVLPIAWIGLSLASAAQEAPPGAVAQQVETRIDAYLRPFDEIGHLSGTLLVAHGDRVVYERSFGLANYELTVPNAAETKFNVASITKPMTKIALLRLLEQEKLGLEDPLSKWIPDFPRGDEITVEHLARHRSGIAHRVTEPHEETRPRTAADMVEFARQRPLMFDPGERYNYSSGGFSVLARVLELAGGKPYAALLEELVFAPAGMQHSVHTDSRTVLPRRASSYLLGPDGAAQNVELKDLSYLVGAGSVYSTARDLYALARAVRSGEFGPSVHGSFVGEEGFDWNGVTNGFRAFVDWHRERDVTVIFTGNLQTGAANRIRRDVPLIASGEDVPPAAPPAVTPVEISEDRLRSYEGVYELRPGSPLRVRVEGRGLRVNDWILIATGERSFFSPQDYATIEVVLDDEGRPQRLDWIIDGNPYPCPRVGP